jgi:hypothetical protein
VTPGKELSMNKIGPEQIFLAQCKAERTLSSATGSFAHLPAILRLPYINSDLNRRNVAG